MSADWNVDKYRSSHEPTHHWELKKAFMESIKHQYSEQEVVCLAQTLGNIEFMGCTYPHDTMVLIRELSVGVVEEFRENRRGRLQRTFVSGSAAANSKINRTNPSFKNTGEEGENTSLKRSGEGEGEYLSKRTKYANFVAASDSNSEIKEIPGFILPPANNRENCVRSVRLEDGDLRIRINRNQGNSDDLSSKPEEEGEVQRSFRMPNYQKSVRLELRMNYDYPLHDFLLVTLAYMPDENPCNILQRSAGFCKMTVGWQYRGAKECYVSINNYEVCSEFGDSRSEARDAATKRAVEILSENCYTVEIKSKYLSDGTQVDLIDVEDNTKVGGKKEALGTGNVGHKLLSLMGWSGGGLGRDGGGISEPITAKSIFGREGLGATGVGKHFKQKIQKIIQEYISSGSPYDLVFTTGFDNEQRKSMHDMARRFGLKSKSYGKGDDRHLTLSRKFDAKSLVEELLRRGGESEKYVLIPPSKYS
ncbi:uncharacterized protein LOC111703196 isoform X2 [Eurytemora carolleeae]|uniref:uncharacterized protein LOC111703196 isoform X2 n=1 Tax=Eurytemora carolleeae TaxID=1294199 RepID=UPI000C77216C|nr:uncharacterized protein LOC111703196 isoform X2 [Eurytemora carolleeae]|eukprot:XP_023330843.1 uncharacterized protein LOC111703196 isoform X2 [Eurytemora affinis]